MKIICVGRNYVAHARELGNQVPARPVLFLKPQTALLRPGQALYYPEFTSDLHYECELVLKICRNGKYIQEKFAHKYYDAITTGIDFTARDVQQRQKEQGLPWEIAKAFDGSAATGTFLPVDAAKQDAGLDFCLYRNGYLVQQGNGRDMLFPPAQIIAYASQFFTLNTGDLIFTGTPAGTGAVAIQDVLEATLQGEKLLEVAIR